MAEQDEIIRLDHPEVLMIEDGPGTGKTVVALRHVILSGVLSAAPPVQQRHHASQCPEGTVVSDPCKRAATGPNPSHGGPCWCGVRAWLVRASTAGDWLLCHGLQNHGVLGCLGWECAFADSHAVGRRAAHVSWCFVVRLAAAGSDRIRARRHGEARFLGVAQSRSGSGRRRWM
jgi:hypothetical protein